MKKGFTLVELSIVLVIIGLLIGGTLVGRSLQSAAQMSDVVKQIQQIDIAVSNFKAAYRALPGDSLSFTLQDQFSITQGTAHGDNNGYINYNTTGMPPNHCSNTGLGCAFFVGEIANFWVNLSGTEDYPGKFSANIPVGGFNSDKQNLNAPIFKIGGNSFSFIPVPCNRPDVKNCYQGANYDSFTLSDPRTGGHIAGDGKVVVPPEIMLAIDKKVDDGMPLTGKLQNIILDLTTAQQITDQNHSYMCSDLLTNGNDPVTAKYTFTNSACYFSFGILTQVPN